MTAKEELYRITLWKAKRAPEDIAFDDTIDHYVLSVKEKGDIDV